MASSKISPQLLFLLKLLVTIALFTFLWHKINITELITCLKKINPLIFLLCIFLYALSQVISSYRWKLLLKARKIQVPLRRLVSFYFVGMFFNIFLPTLIGGDVMRSYDLSRYTKKISDSVASIFTERFIGFLALLLIVLLSLGFTYQKIDKTIIPLFILTITCLTILIIFLLTNTYLFNKVLLFIKIFRSQRLIEEVKKIHSIFLAYRQEKLALFKVLNLSFLVQMLNFFIYYLIAQALGLNLSFVYFTLFVPIIILMAMLPISFQGLGIREGTSIFLFGQLGVSATHAFFLTLICFAVVVVTSLGGGVIFLFRGKEKIKVG